MIKCHLGPQLSVWIMQVSLFYIPYNGLFSLVQIFMKRLIFALEENIAS